MTQDFKNAVEGGNLPAVRMMLSNELLFDPRGKTFEEMLQYAKDRLPGLFEAEEPSRFAIPADKEDWTDDTLSKMKRDLNMNFSVEKLALFVEMAKTVGADKARSLDEQEEEERRARAARAAGGNAPGAACRRHRPYKQSGTVVTGSGAVIAITGLCIEGAVGTALSIIGGVVAIGGVILLSVTDNKKKDGQ